MADTKFSALPTADTPVDADVVPVIQSGAGKKLSWSGIKSALKTYFDTLYAAISHTHAQSDVTNLTTDLGNKQPLDSDLTTIASLTATSDNVIQAVASAWASRTPAQLKATLTLVKGDVGLSNVDNTTDVGKPVSTAQQAALDGKAASSHAHSLADITDEGALASKDTVAAGDIDNDAVTADKLANMAQNTIKGRITASTGNPEDLTVAQTKTVLNYVPGDIGAAAAAHTHTLADVTDEGALASKNTVATGDIDNDAVNYAKMQNVSATDKLLGRSTAGAGDVEEIPLTAAGRALLDDASASAQRTTLGLGAVALLASITEADITLADNTTGDVSTTKHGFAPKAPDEIGRASCRERV